jgi:hypothetical protein
MGLENGAVPQRRPLIWMQYLPHGGMDVVGAERQVAALIRQPIARAFVDEPGGHLRRGLFPRRRARLIHADGRTRRNDHTDKMFTTCAVLTMPPPIAARMAVTIDSISHGRFGVNIISGWHRREYTQMGMWPGSEHYRRRYEYCAGHVTVMKQLWETGRSDFKGDFFQMDDCRCLPTPTSKIPIICAAQSDAGSR